MLAPIQESANKTSPWVHDLLLGFEKNDDAAVFRVNENTAAILTVDFLTPLVDDPYDFGRIAAANALSDIYAVGAQPTCALNVLAIDSALGSDVASDILRGGADAVSESGALVVGGHSIDDPEPKYGLCVFGTADPDHIVRNEGACVGDALYLTKPLGVGLLSAAYKVGTIDPETFQPTIDSMKELNRAGSISMSKADAHAATDVTGFGLAGHLHEMLQASGVGAELYWTNMPLMDHAWELSCAYCRPNRTFSIMDFATAFVEQGALDDDEFDNRMGIICDPQTSGGLLVAIPPERTDIFEATFEKEAGRPPSLIGRIVDDPQCHITFKESSDGPTD